jgi:hypothetical protein
LPQPHQAPFGFPDCSHTRRSDSEKTFCPAPSFRRRITQSGTDKTFRLEPLQSGVDCTERHIAPGLVLDFPRDRYAVRALVKPDNGQHHQQLEFTEIVWSGHFFEYTEEIDGRDCSVDAGAFHPRKFGQIGTQLITYAPEQSEPFFVGAAERCWVFKAVMQVFRRAEKHRAGFAGAVAYRDDVAEVLAVKFFDGFRAMPGNVNA